MAGGGAGRGVCISEAKEQREDNDHKRLSNGGWGRVPVPMCFITSPFEIPVKEAIIALKTH